MMTTSNLYEYQEIHCIQQVKYENRLRYITWVTHVTLLRGTNILVDYIVDEKDVKEIEIEEIKELFLSDKKIRFLDFGGSYDDDDEIEIEIEEIEKEDGEENEESEESDEEM